MTTISYYLNGAHLDGWDENDYEAIDIDAAVANLTYWEHGDVLTAVLTRDGEVIDTQHRTLLD